MRTATQEMMRIDLRRRRAEALVHTIMLAIRPHLSDDRDSYRDAMETLWRLLRDNGYEVPSDYDRSAMGLPPRGPDGWTTDEIVALERARLEAIMKPISMTISKDDFRTLSAQRQPHELKSAVNEK